MSEMTNICPVCGENKDTCELIQIHPIYDEYMCYDCLPDDIKKEFDKCFREKPKETEG